ncbi:response regulator transcription factor [Hymenobacter sp. RP-2-7]|uniref:Response regulator transcription factor n=1 Tax=Hymenobacter polaris TaxID=2682546 RepID=A0A7Y0FLA8_9BACT|nr:response regulator transcription factor [Hymenobacter polaris]NML64305.1 response regulator transcription factor [Hymenobacter polaris]
MRILVIEDEPRLAEFMRQGLTQAGHVADAADNGATGLEMAAATPYDVILLDLMLPGQNGFDVLRNLREFGLATPVIIVSALSGTEHVIKGLDAGAVDYLRKPFAFDELLARLRTVQRRPATTESPVLRLADLELDLVHRRAARAGQVLALTNREFALLELLLRHPGRVITKTYMAEKVWEVDFDMGSNVIEVHLSQLRRKIDRAFPTRPPLLETVVGHGYRLRNPAPAA